jgi:esterase/lipase superfamily enzyme
MWYVTDRKPCRSGGMLHSFSNRRNAHVHTGQVIFGTADFLSSCLQSTRGWRLHPICATTGFRDILRREDPEEVNRCCIQELLDHIRQHCHMGSQVLVLIHGFSISFEKAVRSAARLANQLDRLTDGRFSVPVIVYSWASWGSWLTYLPDKRRVEATIRPLTTLLECCSRNVRTLPANSQTAAHGWEGVVLRLCTG